MSQIQFKDVNHKSQNKSECIYERSFFDGILKRKLYIFKKDPNGNRSLVNVPCWLASICSCFGLLLLAILIAAIVILLNAKKPALYGKNCENRSCQSGLNMKCIDNICTCHSDEYYAASCYAKRTFGMFCDRNYQCLETKRLECLDGKCVCNSTQYWTGSICMNKKTYRQTCSGDQCLTDLLLYCNKKTGFCECNSTR